MYQWRKGIAAWKCGDTLLISVPFTWLIEQAEAVGQGKEHWYIDEQGKKHYHKGPYIIGGPGTMTPSECPGFEPVLFHDPAATFTTRGCPNRCPFCAVPRIEGDFREIPDFRPAPMVCDNNLLAASRRHLEKVVDKLKGFAEVDFNQGLEARRFTREIADLFAGLRCKIRFAFDYIGAEAAVADAIKLCRERTTRNIRVYVLIGFNDTPEEARYRLEKVREWGIWPNAMRYQPLDAAKKNAHVTPGWTADELARMTRYYNTLRYSEHIPYEDFKYRERERNQGKLFIATDGRKETTHG